MQLNPAKTMHMCLFEPGEDLVTPPTVVGVSVEFALIHSDRVRGVDRGEGKRHASAVILALVTAAARVARLQCSVRI